MAIQVSGVRSAIQSLDTGGLERLQEAKERLERANVFFPLMEGLVQNQREATCGTSGLFATVKDMTQSSKTYLEGVIAEVQKINETDVVAFSFLQRVEGAIRSLEIFCQTRAELGVLLCCRRIAHMVEGLRELAIPTHVFCEQLRQELLRDDSLKRTGSHLQAKEYAQASELLRQLHERLKGAKLLQGG